MMLKLATTREYTKRALLSYLRSSFAKINMNSEKRVVLSNKSNRELMEFKKQIAKKEPIKSEALYEEFHYREVYKRISIQMESFFFERPYSLENFNFLINLIAEQSPADYLARLEEALRKMDLLAIKPNEKTYNYLVKAAGKAGDTSKAEAFFKQASQKFLPNKYLYTSLMQSYVISNDPTMALKIVEEMQSIGLQPDLPVYTTLINCFRQGRKLEKCWEVHNKLLVKKIPVDETYTGVMLKVYAATHDAEKAIKIYKENITDKNIKPMVETVNAYLKALSGRRDYASVAIDKFFLMVETGQVVNEETSHWALTACATSGSIKSAGEILKVMQNKKMKIEAPILSTLLRVYAKVCSEPLLEEEQRQVILADCWKILEKIEQKKGVTTSVLNNMLSIYANSINKEEVDGLILPLYEKFGQPHNMLTFEILIEMYYKLADYTTAMRVWKQMNTKIKQNQQTMLQKHEPLVRDLALEDVYRDERGRPTFKALHCYLDIGIKMLDMKQVLEALELFKKMKRMPKNETLKFLGNLKDLPEEIQVSLMDFKIQFGKARISKKRLPQIDDPQNITPS